MKLLLDSNIVIDFIAKREPFCTSAEKLMLLGLAGDVELWVSTTQANDIFYVLGQGKKNNAELVKRKMQKLKTFIRFCGLDEDHFLNVLTSSWADLEDACVYEVGLHITADAIITRDKKDFEKSTIPIYDYDNFFEFMKSKGLEYDFAIIPSLAR